MEISPNSTPGIGFPARSQDSANLYLLGAISFIVIAVVSWLWLSNTSNSKEPPQLYSRIPLVGHLLGMMRHEAEYFMKLSTRQSWPIFTIKIFTSRLYVITSPELVQAVFRNSKSLSFEPVANTASARVMNFSKDLVEKLSTKPSDPQDSTFVSKTNRGMHSTLQANAALLQMNSRALNQFAVFLNEIDTTEKPINLWRWVRDCFNLASAEAMYGHENPIAEDHSLIQSLEEFEASIGLLYLNILPSITARKGYLARIAFAKAFQSYYDRGLLKNASVLIQGRYRDLASGGLTSNDIANIEILIIMAATMNSVNGAFWMVCYLFSDEQLLSEIRAEVSAITTRRSKDGIEEICLDVSQLQKSCPLLTSAWQETLRVNNVAVGQRVVMEDVTLNDAYFLKKGSLIQIPARIMHESKDIWGPDANVFNARRFLKSNVDSMTREQKKLQKQGLIPFGGGVSLCPGRHFATTETLGMAATLLMGYEMRMADGSGTLKIPEGQKQRMAVAVKLPVDGLDVLIKRRKEFEGVSWTYDVGGEVDGSDMVF